MRYRGVGPVPVGEWGGEGGVGVGVHLAYRVYRYSSIIPRYLLPSGHSYPPSLPQYPGSVRGHSLPSLLSIEYILYEPVVRDTDTDRGTGSTGRYRV